MPRDFARIPDGGAPEGVHVAQLIESWMGLGEGVRMRLTEVNDAGNFALKLRNRGAGGKHQQIRKSDDDRTLFEVTDGGVRLSAAGEAAGHALLRINMGVLWFGTAAGVPSGWTIVMQGKFPYGASVDGDVGATGGGVAAHTHSHSHAPGLHTHTLASHTHSATHGHPLDLTSNPTVGTLHTSGGGGTGVYADHKHEYNVPSTAVTTGAPSVNVSGTPSTANTDTDATAASAVDLPPFERCYFLKRTA